MTRAISKFGVDDDLIYDAAIYDAQDDFDYDVPFYLKYARNAKGPVLELCCGTGRITLPLASAGIDITGIDFTPSMIKRAREKAKSQKLSVPLLQGDMRKVRLKKRFNLVFIPFNSIQNTYSLSDIEKVFQTVHKHLKPNGRFIFDIFNPSIHYMAKYKRVHKGLYKFRTEDGRRVVIDQLCQYLSTPQINRTSWIFHIDGTAPKARKLDMRCFYPQEIDALLKYNGFKVLRKFGSFEEEPFANESMKQLFICKKA